MPERLQRYLRLICICLGALLLYQVFKFATAPDPFAAPSMLAPSAAPAESSGNALPGGSDIPPAVQARVDQITRSEILGPIPQPPPMALLGIGGDDILLRTATGQTGILRVGETLGGVKLVSIGINRVLVEHEGERKELMMFMGLGGESLMSTPNSNESPR